jgi:hypothetical protein
MLQTKTHFEQVPLEIVRKIIEEQIRLETATEQNRATKKMLGLDLWGAQEQSIARSRTFSQAEVLKQP